MTLIADGCEHVSPDDLQRKWNTHQGERVMSDQKKPDNYWEVYVGDVPPYIGDSSTYKFEPPTITPQFQTISLDDLRRIIREEAENAVRLFFSIQDERERKSRERFLDIHFSRASIEAYNKASRANRANE